MEQTKVIETRALDAYTRKWLKLLELDLSIKNHGEELLLYTSVYRFSETLEGLKQKEVKTIKLVVFDDLFSSRELFFKPLPGLTIVLIKPSDYLAEVKGWPFEEALAWGARRILQEIPALKAA